MASILVGKVTSVEEKSWTKDGQEKIFFLLTIGEENPKVVSVWNAGLMTDVAVGQKLKLAVEQKGKYTNVIDLTLADDEPDTIPEVVVEPAHKESLKEKSRGSTVESKKFDESFLVDIKGKKFVRLNGLLDMATKQGIKSISSNAWYTDAEGKAAMGCCTVEMKDGKSCSMMGSANPLTLKPQLVGYAIEMANTRSLARALRTLLNVDFVSVEEMTPED